jgi:hypothetical protein
MRNYHVVNSIFMRRINKNAVSHIMLLAQRSYGVGMVSLIINVAHIIPISNNKRR